MRLIFVISKQQGQLLSLTSTVAIQSPAMERFLYLFSLLLGISATLASSLSAKDSAARAPIWLLEGENATIYLAGSVHLLREKDLPIPAAFDEVYDLCDEVVFELDIAEMMDPATSKRVQKNGMLPKGETFEDHFDESTSASIRSYLGDLGVPARAFDQMKPGTLLITLTSLAATKQGARPDLGLEIQYYRKAINDNKRTSGLETMDYQMSLFHGLETETVQRLINDMIDEQDQAGEALERVIGAWKSGDPKQIEDIIVSELAEEEEMKELLLTRRNKNWIPAILEALEGDKNIMFLVGAAHLAGEGSVIDLLEKEGFAPVQMNPVRSLP